MRSSNVISSLPRMTFACFLETKGVASADQNQDQDGGCPVCMDCYSSEQEVIELPCQHFFHAECSEGWLKVCPYYCLACFL